MEYSGLASLLVVLISCNVCEGGSAGRLSIAKARHIDTRPPEHVEQETADWLQRASAVAHLLINNEQVREQDQAESWTVTPIDDFSQVKFECPYFPPSASIPTSVHALRPGDIKVVAALGDSITAGNGIRSETALGTWSFANRGESFSVGGERSLDEGSITLLNIIRKFNPTVAGGSYCGRRLEHEYAGYNVAVPGNTNRGLESQARDLVSKLARDEGTFYDSWKVVTLLIGGNDMCRHCLRIMGRNFTAQKHREGIEWALDVLYEHLPRTFVNLQIMTEIGFVKDLYTNETQEKCRSLHEIACPCALESTPQELKKLQMDYYSEITKLVDSGKYDGRDDFTVVVQPFLRDQIPFTNEDGTYDMSFFAPDCFHPGVKMHQSFAYMLWNTMLTPVQDKAFKWDESMEIKFMCPTEKHPYLFTKRNS